MISQHLGDNSGYPFWVQQNLSKGTHKVYDRCNQATAIQFIDEVRRRLPFRIMVIQTDNGAEFQSHFHWHLEDLDIQHAYMRPRTPHLNGKVEPSHRVDDQEFYQLLHRYGVTDDIYLFNTST